MGAVRVNPKLAEQLQEQPAFNRALARAAGPALEQARAATPRGFTGRAQASLALVVDDAGVRLISTHPFWHLIEFGSQNNPAYAPLRRGVRAAGLHLQEHNP